MVEFGRKTWEIWKVTLESWEDDDESDESEEMSSCFTDVLDAEVSGGSGVGSGDGGRRDPGIF
jgi:hypothetical protein